MGQPNQEGMWIFAPDIHVPATDWQVFDAMVDFITHNDIRGFIFGGDQLDNTEISHHNKKKIIFRERGAYKANTKMFDERVLKVVESKLGKTAIKVWIEGNHDNWESQLIEEQPELEGSIERPLQLGLEARGWNVVPLGKGYKVGKLLAIHGETLTGMGNQAGKYPSATAVDKYAQSVIHGHVHTMQVFTKVLPHDHHEKWAAYSSPVIAKRNPGYARNKPNAVVNGFSIIEVDSDRNFQVWPVVVTGGKFLFSGVRYGR